jgi:hypothetical protein
MSTEVGLAIKAAMEHGEHYRQIWPQRLMTVPMMTRWGGYVDLLTISATIATRDQAELENSASTPAPIHWQELDRRANELVIVVQCVPKWRRSA